MKKPGYKTSEFWLAIGSILLLVIDKLLELKILDDIEQWPAIIAGVYALGRSFLKSSEAVGSAQVEEAKILIGPRVEKD